MNAAPLRNEMILASAGSGKTYQLTNRYIRLMALGAEPERIIALTFTRKAAGEFFDEILRKLAGAVRDDAGAAALADAIDCPGTDRERFLDMLARLISRMHRLELGTLDSFFYRVVRNFPFELGLAGPPEILDENAVRVEKLRVYEQVFRRPAAGEEARRDFLEAFKQATWGTEEKRLSRLLDRFVDEHHQAFLAAPEGRLWGRAARIWPEGNPWLGVKVDPDQELAALDAAFAEMTLTPRQRETWQGFRDALAAWKPGAPWAKEMHTPVGNILKAWDPLNAGEADFTIGGKKLRVSGGVCRGLTHLLVYLFGAELEKKLQVTRGLYEVLRAYETVYGELVRSSGRLTFADILILLSGTPGDAGTPVLGQGGGDGDRLDIDYRLDARYDHWLLDEFQDTSYAQWRVLGSLIDEVLQDPEGRRSFFYVGDVKQAIYAWRDGDVRLFREIFDTYNRGSEERIVERRMSESRRSGPAVIETVNRVFGAHAVFDALFPESAVKRWREGWDTHRAHQRDLAGCVRFVQAAEPEARYALVLETLREVDPLNRGLSCAVLVQRNAAVREILHVLRENGEFPVVAETDIRPGADNVLGAVLSSLFRYAAHPGDRFAREHLLMTPLGAWAEDHGPGGLAAAARDVLETVHRDGFAAAAEGWIGRLESLGVLDAFTRRRADEILAAAREFDRSGERTIADFVDFLGSYSLREAETPEAIQVMTVHKAKGLGWDVVILPELGGQKLAQRRSGLGVCRNEDREVEWVLDMPAKTIVDNDEVLGRYDAEAAADACYEKFCQLYVAMTRAKRAMYLIGEPVKATSTSHNFLKLLDETLNTGEPERRRFGEVDAEVVYETEDPAWYAGIEPGKQPAVTGPELPVREFPGRPRRKRKTPSRAKARRVPAASLFSLDSRKSLDYGTRVHEIFSRIEWFDTDTTERIGALREEEAGIPMTAEACDEILACLREGPVREALSRPHTGAEVWRERSFEVILDDEWLTGTFDRVTVEKDKNGRPSRAAILDFKTDKIDPKTPVDPAESGYADQLRAYRRVLAFMTGLEERAISCRLLFTQRRALVDVG